MWTAWLEPNAVAVVFLGAAVPIVGLLALLTQPTPRRRLGVAVGAVILLLLGAGLALASQPPGLWLPPVLLALFCSASVTVRSDWVGRAVYALALLLRRPVLHAAVLIAAGPTLAFGWIQLFSPVSPVWVEPAETKLAREPVRLREDAALRATTDSGRIVLLYRPADPATAEERLLEMDESIIATRKLTASVIRTAPATKDYNCHGWVFGDGRGWIPSEEVEDILRDNGYHTVSDARPGDVAIYRNSQGQIIHSAIARSIVSGGPVLIESKWGKGGRYVSEPDAPPYGSQITFYRSLRRTNCLHGLGSDGSDAPTTVETAALQTN